MSEINYSVEPNQKQLWKTAYDLKLPKFAPSLWYVESAVDDVLEINSQMGSLNLHPVWIPSGMWTTLRVKRARLASWWERTSKLLFSSTELSEKQQFKITESGILSYPMQITTLLKWSLTTASSGLVSFLHMPVHILDRHYILIFSVSFCAIFNLVWMCSCRKEERGIIKGRPWRSSLDNFIEKEWVPMQEGHWLRRSVKSPATAWGDFVDPDSGVQLHLHQPIH